MSRSSFRFPTLSLICRWRALACLLALPAAVLPATATRAASIIPEESYCEFGCTLPELDDPANPGHVAPLLPIGGFEANPFRKFVPLQSFIRTFGTGTPDEPATPQQSGRPAN